MSTRYTNTKRRRVKKSSEASSMQTLAKWLFLGLATIVTLAGLGLLILDPRNSSDSQEDKYPYGLPSTLTDQAAFRRAYLAANFSNDANENTSSIIVTGRIESPEGKTDFLLVRKRPGSMRMTLETNTYEMAVGVHEGEVWQRIRIPQREDILKTLDGTESLKWREQAAFFDRIARTFNGEGSIEKIEFIEDEAEQWLKVHLTRTEHAPPVKIWIDPQTIHPSFQVEEMENGVIQKTEFSDYRHESGIAIPYQQETSLDGVFVSRIIIDSVSINGGVVSSIFKKPEN